MKSKHICLLASCLMLTTSIFCQAPQGFKWQGLAKDATGNAVTQPVTLTFTILQNNGAVYVEAHNSITPNAGQITATVGSGSPTLGDFVAIDWSTGQHSLNVKMQIGSGALVDMGTSQILPVPIALYAKRSSDWGRFGDSTVFTLVNKVGVGTNIPETELDVAGKITATDLLRLRPSPGALDDSTKIRLGGAVTNGSGFDFFRLYFNEGLDDVRKNFWFYGNASRKMDVSVDGKFFIGKTKDGSSINNSSLLNLYAQGDNADTWISSYDEDDNQLWILNMADRSQGNSFGLFSTLLDNYVSRTRTNGTLELRGSNSRRIQLYADDQDTDNWIESNDENGNTLWIMNMADRSSDNRFRLFSQSANNGAGSYVFSVSTEGHTTTRVLEITGGDVAEARHSTTGEQLPPGSVVVFDEKEKGKIRLTSKAYDKQVAGAISGAGNYFAGVCLLQEELSKGAMPVAQIGTVEVLAIGPIEVGDLLTTSAMPGYAMKAKSRRKRDSAVIGKAVASLKSGERGLVEMQIEKH